MIAQVPIETGAFQGLLDRLQGMWLVTREGALAFVAAAVVMLAGWLLAVLLDRLTRLVLGAVGFNRPGRPFLSDAFGGHEPAVIAGMAVRWIVLAIAAILAVDVLGFDLSGALAFRLSEVIPRVLAATLLLVGGSVAAILLGALTRRFFASAGVKGARLRGQIVSGIFTFFAVVVALEQLGFAAQFVLAIGLIVAGTAGLAVALAFGLGCRELARDFVIEYFKNMGDDDRGRG